MKTKFDVGNRTIFILLSSGRRFALGFCISPYGFDLDLGPFWLTIEWWYNDSTL
jgi:hypothetical protein